MNKNTWIIIFFAVLAGHIVGIRVKDRNSTIVYKGGRSYRIDFKKTVDPRQLHIDLSKELEGEIPIVNVDGDNTIFDITTSYMIEQTGRLTDSIVLTKLISGLKNYLPAGITNQQFDTAYKVGSKIILPAAYDRSPDWVHNIVYPFLLYGCKALLIPLLIFYFFVQTKKKSTANLKKWIIAALIFSWLGDILLLFVPRNELFFLLGLASFLAAHIFYILFFHQLRVKEKIKNNPWLMAAVVVYYATLITLLFPFLGEMKIPVLVYGVVITSMLLLAMHMLFIKNKTAGKWMMTGALLFVISDSMLAINKFYQPFEAAGVLIMLTYGLAQYFIIRGTIKYIRA